MVRALTPGEAHILALIESHYGPQDLQSALSWSDDEARLFVRDSAGVSVLVANLSNLAEWRADGIIGSDDDLRRDWLRIGDT
jgi:hypothetical protein